MDMIDLMPPGLYEAVITGVNESVENPELVRGDYLFSLEARTLDHIRALGGNSPEDDLRFATAKRVSEINQGLYRTFLQPAVGTAVNEQGAESSAGCIPTDCASTPSPMGTRSWHRLPRWRRRYVPTVIRSGRITRSWR